MPNIFNTTKLVLFSSLWLVAISVSAQNSSIKGKVFDMKGEPLPYSIVWIDSLDIKSITGANGKYTLNNVPPGRHIVSVQMMGFVKGTKAVLLQGNTIGRIDFQLREDSQMLDDIMIVAESEKSKIEKAAKVVNVIDTKEDKLKTADLGEVLARSEGVSVQRAGGLGSNMRFSLNGLTDDQIRFFVDEIPIEASPYSLGLANIPVNLIKRMEIYKGVLPVQFGTDALGGGINVISNSVEKGVHADVSYQVGSFQTNRSTLSLSYRKTRAFARINGFYDYSANNYDVDVQVVNDLGKKEDVTVPRFHDDYRAHGVNVTAGIADSKSIEELSLTAFFNDLYKEVQHNNVMSGVPYGHVYRKRNSIGATGKANFNWDDKWMIENNLGFSKNQREFADTSAWVYNWHGQQILRKDDPTAGETPENRKSRLYLWDYNYFMRNLTSFQANEKIKLSVSIAPTYNQRTGDELFSGTWDPATTESKLLTWVNSFEFNYKNARWENNFFVKHYLQKGESEEPLPADLGSKNVPREETLWGAGNVLIYKVSEKFWIKPSYEYAIRLPRSDEIFGDGAFTADNLELGPENSHNFNVQFNYSHTTPRMNLSIQSNVFGRIIDDLILLIPNNDRSAVYDNVFTANSYGIELGAKTKLIENKLRLSANTTFQHFYNSSDEGHFSRFEGDRIPNRPYYFANAASEYAFHNILGAKNQLLLFWQLRYTYEYFLTWESLGSVGSKAIIPSQLLQNAGFSYHQSLGGNAYTFSLEFSNLTNQKAFDFYGVQRPGRAVYLKIIANI